MQAKRFLPFHEARELVRTQQLCSVADWQQWRRVGGRACLSVPSRPQQVTLRHPPLLPDSPVASLTTADCRMLDAQVYENDWVSWGDFLGYDVGKPAVRTYLPFEEARELVRLEKLTTHQQWRDWCDAYPSVS